jgi:hypothetical protein
LMPILEGVLARGLHLRFHTPNGLHVREVTAELAVLMYRAGFATVRLPLETIDPSRQRSTGGKVTTDAFEAGVAYLKAAGFGSQGWGLTFWPDCRANRCGLWRPASAVSAAWASRPDWRSFRPSPALQMAIGCSLPVPIRCCTTILSMHNCMGPCMHKICNACYCWRSNATLCAGLELQSGPPGRKTC